MADKQDRLQDSCGTHDLTIVPPITFGFVEYIIKGSSQSLGIKEVSKGYKYFSEKYVTNITALKNDLERLFLKDIEQKSKKLSNLASSQSNESFNFTLSTKAPKYKHYSGSSSLGYRVSASVLQKNEGYSYISEVNESAGLSPGNMSIKRATLLDKRGATKLQKSRTRKCKTERKRLKEMKLAKNSGLEIREGKTYESEIGMTEQNVDEIEIPDPPEIREFTDNILTAPILIYDLETTGLQRTSDIIQIAAYSQNNKFSSYIMPNRVMSNGASAVTNISVIGSQMYYNLQPVPSKLQNDHTIDIHVNIKVQTTGQGILSVTKQAQVSDVQTVDPVVQQNSEVNLLRTEFRRLTGNVVFIGSSVRSY
ncbi:uncharacterized protein [Mytilus edulis]|uniref:uncharacterized protein n=1 Tax=Mytilus edulis TaxID=6550 RepID=UPI0039EEE931